METNKKTDCSKQWRRALGWLEELSTKATQSPGDKVDSSTLSIWAGPLHYSYATQSCSSTENCRNSPNGTDKSILIVVTGRPSEARCRKECHDRPHTVMWPRSCSKLLQGCPDLTGQTMQGADGWRQKPGTFRMIASKTLKNGKFRLYK